MSNSKFIKVTLNGETTPRIVLSTLKPFFLSQGAKVEIPTDEEVYAAEPALRPKTAPEPVKAGVDPAVVEQLRKGEAYLKARIEERDTTIKEQGETITALREKLAATETALKEAETLVDSLRSELKAKPKGKAKDAE